MHVSFPKNLMKKAYLNTINLIIPISPIIIHLRQSDYSNYKSCVTLKHSDESNPLYCLSGDKYY
jgi:hypothetical protein